MPVYQQRFLINNSSNQQNFETKPFETNNRINFPSSQQGIQRIKCSIRIINIQRKQTPKIKNIINKQQIVQAQIKQKQIIYKQEYRKFQNKTLKTNQIISSPRNFVNRKPMVEVIQLHYYQNEYPFGLVKEHHSTYVEMVKQILSEEHLESYNYNLQLFKSIPSRLIIKLDSYVRERNRFHIYYEYEPLSIRKFVEEKLVLFTQKWKREKFIMKTIADINRAIEQVISLLIEMKILGILSIENMAITDNQSIKFFIEPDFDFVQTPTKNQLNEYYATEKKKLQIQLEEFMQHIFASTNSKGRPQGKANFIIQGNKLVFVKDQHSNRKDQHSNRQSSMSAMSSIGSGEETKNSTSRQEPHQKQKFDIKNILNENKIQKDYKQNMQSLPNDPRQTQVNLDQKNKNQQFLTFDTRTKNLKKDVKNYFENNDDFKKDASFYPEEFLIEESIAQLDGYEDELEKELENLKKKNQQKKQINVSPNRLSMLPNADINIYERSQEKNSKLSVNPQIKDTTINGHQQNCQKYPSRESTFPQKNQLNLSNSQEKDLSNEHKQKKKYKVIITTSHEVSIENTNKVDIKQIEQELIEEIKEKLVSNDIGKHSHHLHHNLKIIAEKEKFNHNFPPQIFKGRETHNPSSSKDVSTSPLTNNIYKNTSLNSVGSIINNSIDEYVADDKPFSKHHQAPSSTSYLNMVNPTPTPPNIKKIIEKIKSNQQSTQPIQQSNIFQLPKPTQHELQASIQKQPVTFQEGHQPQSRLSFQSVVKDKNVTQLPQLQKEYYEKIQKAKMKAEEIIKIVKERKIQ